MSAAHGRIGTVYGQPQRGNVLQLRPPVFKLAVEFLNLQPFTLPHGVVCVLNGKRLQVRMPAGDPRLIKFPDLTQQQAHGPAIRHDVMQGQPHAIFLRSQLPQMSANQRTTGEIKGRIHHLLQLAARLQFPLFFFQRGQISYRDFQFERSRDDLMGHAIIDLHARAQCLVPLHDLVQAGLESFDVQRPAHPCACGDYIGGIAGMHLLQKPEPLLGVRQRNSFRTLAGGERQRRLTTTRLHAQPLNVGA